MSNRLAVFVSGSGTLLEAMLAYRLPIHLVLADRPCRGIDVVAHNAHLQTALLFRQEFGPSFDRKRFTSMITDTLSGFDIGLVAMAGFMTVLSPEIFYEYEGRILNTHPALLPHFKGAHAVRDALLAGVTETGCTIHVATEHLDDGPILAQERVPVLEGDTEATLHERIKAVERELYPETIATYLRTLS